MDDIATLRRELDALAAESAVRRLIGRYMFLCDVPLAEPGMDDAARVAAIGALFSDDGVWEGVGGAHGAQFGRHVGPAAVAAHMASVYGARDSHMVFNTHYLCSEQLRAEPQAAEGNWVQVQPWIFDDGTSLIRSSRLHVRFRATDVGWRIARYRTENLFIGALPADWATTRIAQAVLMQPISGGER